MVKDLLLTKTQVFSLKRKLLEAPTQIEFIPFSDFLQLYFPKQWLQKTCEESSVIFNQWILRKYEKT